MSDSGSQDSDGGGRVSRLPRIRRRLTRMGMPDLRLEVSVGDVPRKQRIAYEHVLDKLIADAQLDVLLAIKDQRVKLPELVELDRKQRLSGSSVLANATLSRPLFSTWEETIKRMDCGEQTKLRYDVSRQSLQRRAAPWLREDATILELKDVPWARLREQWLTDASGSDWNLMRRALSAFLSAVLGNKLHPFRGEVLYPIKPAKERKRIPDLPVETFAKVLERVDEGLRPAYMTIAGLGLRAGEYGALGPDSFDEKTMRLTVGGKTGKRSITVPGELYPWVKAAIPPVLSYWPLLRVWQEACTAEGVTGDSATLHALRHCTGQWADGEGMSLVKIKNLLGHSTISMTARYAESNASGEVSRAVIMWNTFLEVWKSVSQPKSSRVISCDQL